MRPSAIENESGPGITAPRVNAPAIGTATRALHLVLLMAPREASPPIYVREQSSGACEWHASALLPTRAHDDVLVAVANRAEGMDDQQALGAARSNHPRPCCASPSAFRAAPARPREGVHAQHALVVAFLEAEQRRSQVSDWDLQLAQPRSPAHISSPQPSSSARRAGSPISVNACFFCSWAASFFCSSSQSQPDSNCVRSSSWSQHRSTRPR